MVNQGSTPARVCPTCGTRLAQSATRCVVCGRELKADESKRAFRGSSQLTLSLPAAIGLLVVFVLVTAVVTFIALRLGGGAAERTPTPTPSLTPTQTLTPAPTFTETPAPTPTPLPPIEYTVVANDTCAALAFRFQVSVRSIIDENKLAPECLLSVGQTILIPQPTPTPPPPPTSTLPPEEATRAACETLTYTVQANDTLGAIAQNYNVVMQAIMDFNGMASETVFVGQVLIIPLCERVPTAGPSPTATPPPPYPAPNLLLPMDGEPFTLANDAVALQWSAVGELRENERYQVTIEDITEGSGTVRDTGYVSDTKYLVPVGLRPSETTPHVFRWWVLVVREVGTTAAGTPRYADAGSESPRRVFTWSGAAIGPSPTP